MKKLISATLLLSLIMVGAIVAVTARADEDERVPVVNNELVKKECGSCHMAYQPQFLPAASWQKIMGNLKDHFGEDASLNEDATRQITDYLVANAGRDRRGEVPERISTQRWFVSEHGKTLSPKLRDKVKSFANCTACHRDADKGYYEDD